MRWMHISDIHFGYTSATVETMRDKLLQMVKEIKKVDCLFITGDLRYGQEEKKAYPPETLDFIQKLQEALGVGPEDTFVVAGNHDVNRNEILQAGIERAAKNYVTSNGAIPDETLSYIRGQRQPFLSLYRDICGQDEPGWHYCRQKNGFNIICLNTALFCCQDNEDGSLVVGSRLLNQLAKTVDSSLPGIVLAHHDFDSLRQDEQRELEIALKDMGAVVYLCGHKHVALARCQNECRADQNLYVFLCGTNMDKDPKLEETDMDVFFGEIDETGKTGFVQAFKWKGRHHDWVPDSDFSYPQNKATDGIRCFPPDARPQPPRTPDMDVQEKYRQFIRRQCSEIELNGLPTNQEDINRKYALTRIFVPLRFKRFEGRDDEGTYELQEAFREAGAAAGELDAHGEIRMEITLEEIIPPGGCFQRFVLSDPGGGKTTLMKWIASAYSFQEGYSAVDLPRRELFPVWIQCRDIPVGSRAPLWNIIENVARLGEWMPGSSAVEDFARLVSHHIEKGTALLLIDGLDEIGSDADRQHFTNQLCVFADSHPSVNMIVTSRITGFPTMTKETKFSNFERFEICPLGKADVEDLCVKWYRIVRGESAESEKKAKDLANKITGDMRIFRLAGNPLLLTTLLLVERRVGKLPTKRTALYDEAIQVLLETWNQAGHEHEKVDLEEARYQLAYIAFHMTVNHFKRITKTELHDLLRTFRQNFSDLVSKGEPISTFISKIEKRSALLIQKGYEESENGRLEAVYEFQHLTFQEYLAAYAAANRCYPDSKDEDGSGAALEPYLLDTTLKETISLTAILDRFCARELASKILEKLSTGEDLGYAHLHLRALLLQFAADEVQLRDEMVDKIFATCFERSLWLSDVKIVRQILEGRYGKKLSDHFLSLDQEYNDGYAHIEPLPLILSGEIADPYQYYMDHRLSESPQEQARALSMLYAGFWLNDIDNLKQLNKTQLAELKEDIFDLLASGNQMVQKEAFYVLEAGGFLKIPEDLSRYIEACVQYINDYQRNPPLWTGVLLLGRMKNVKIKIHAHIDNGTFQKVCARIRNGNIKFENASTYESLLVLALIAVIVRIDKDCLDDIFTLVRERNSKLIVWRQQDFAVLLKSDYKLSKSLQRVVLLDPSYTAQQKKVIQEHILKTDLVSVRRIKQRMEAGEDEGGRFSYNDCSLLDGSEFQLWFPEDSPDEAISYITKRLEAIGSQPEQESAPAALALS